MFCRQSLDDGSGQLVEYAVPHMVLVPPTTRHPTISAAPACGAVLVLRETNADSCMKFSCMLFKECLSGECKAQYAGSPCLAASSGSYLPPDTYCPAQLCAEHCAAQCSHAVRSTFAEIHGRALCTWMLGQEKLVVQESKRQLESHATSEARAADHHPLPQGLWATGCDKRYLHPLTAAQHCDHDLCYSCGNYLALLGLHRCSVHCAWGGQMTDETSSDAAAVLWQETTNDLPLNSDACSVNMKLAGDAVGDGGALHDGSTDYGVGDYGGGSDHDGSCQLSDHDCYDPSPAVAASISSMPSAALMASTSSSSSNLLSTGSGTTTMASTPPVPDLQTLSNGDGCERPTRPPPLAYAQVKTICCWPITLKDFCLAVDRR